MPKELVLSSYISSNLSEEALDLLKSSDDTINVLYCNGVYFLDAIDYDNYTIVKALLQYCEAQIYPNQTDDEAARYRYKIKKIFEQAIASSTISDEMDIVIAPYVNEYGDGEEKLQYPIHDAFQEGDIQYLKQNENDFWDFVKKNDKFVLAKEAAKKDYCDVVDLISDLMFDQYTKAAIYRHAALAIKEQDYNAAKKYLQQAIAIKKDYYPGYKLLGELYNEHGDTYRAAECFIKTDIHKKSKQYTTMYSTLKQILNDSNNQSNTKFVKLAEKYKDQVKNQGLQIILKDISNNHTIKDEASVAESDHLTHEKSSESSDCTKDELPISSNVTTLSTTALKQLDSDKSKDADDLRIIDYIQGVDDVGISSIGESSFQETNHHINA